MKPPPLTRRELLRAAAVGGVALASGCAPRWVAGSTVSPTGAVPQPLPKANDRFAVAMWDFSWATRRWGAEDEYADWDRVLDGLAERGYDTVRIDAFPHLMALHEAVILPQRPRFMWGNHRAVRIRPREDLVAFMQKCRARGISVGLSTWFVPDTTHRRLLVRTPADFARVWNETLSVVEDAGLLDTVRWVDLCNEFPLDVWAPGAAEHIFGSSVSSPFAAAFRGVPWPQAWADRAQSYLTEAIRILKARRQQLKYCYSFHALCGPTLRALDVSEFGVAEVHCWVADDPAWNVSSLQIAPLLEVPGGMPLHAGRMIGTPPSVLKMWAEHYLEPQMKTWAAWASANHLPLVTTEGWGPVNYADVEGRDDEWDWVRAFAELAVEKAVAHGWTGICTSNFCQPHHRGMWRDVGWHRALTGAIRRSA